MREDEETRKVRRTMRNEEDRSKEQDRYKRQREDDERRRRRRTNSELEDRAQKRKRKDKRGTERPPRIASIFPAQTSRGNFRTGRLSRFYSTARTRRVYARAHTELSPRQRVSHAHRAEHSGTHAHGYNCISGYPVSRVGERCEVRRSK
ncbi:luc7-like protein 3 [Prorops nasuta]|uniref:luc7-like protein 3 n=1 Tax=Prorops nasuta TaxID=863751 RepID=UPI0034CF34BF